MISSRCCAARSSAPPNKEALQEFERIAGQRHSIWVNWAKRRAEQVKASSLVTTTWLALADAFHSMGDEDGYKTAIGRAIANVAAGGLLDPGAGSYALLTIADLQKRCNDPGGARTTVKEAVLFCDGIPSASTRSFRLAQCAGLFAGLGDTNGWKQCIGKALGAAAQNVDRRDSRMLPRRKSIAQCVAYS